jgi:alpha-1,2-mannosyltransferase
LVACRLCAPRIDDGSDRRFWLLVLLGFAPAVEMLYVGQVNAFALLAMLLAYGLSERGRPLPAGLMLAAAIVLKTTPIFLLLYFVAVRQWRVIAAALAGLAVLTLLPALPFGSFIVTSYSETVLRLSAEIHAQPLNLGLPALLDRALRALGTDPAAWLVRGAPRLTVAGVALVLLLAGSARQPRGEGRFALFAAFAALGTLASPLIWYHHLVFLLPALAAALVPRSRRWAALGVACLLAIQSERVWETVVTSYPLPAVVGMMVLTAAAAWRAVAVE